MSFPAGIRPRKIFEFIGASILAVVCVAFLLALLVWILSLFLLIGQWGASLFGYRFNISDEIGKAILAVAGAIGVAAIALYGVRSQNRSAEIRHKIDSNLALRKDIFLQVAEAYSTQFRYLLSFGEPDSTPASRKAMIKDSSKAFFKLQFVAAEKTIIAMLEANEAWARAALDIELMGAVEAGTANRILRLMEVQKKMVPFMRKLWMFNVAVRSEIESSFADNDRYLDQMELKFNKISEFFEELRQKIIAMESA